MHRLILLPRQYHPQPIHPNSTDKYQPTRFTFPSECSCRLYLIILTPMGQLNSHPARRQINLNEWVQAIEDSSNSLFNNVNPFRKRLLLHKTTRELIEQYELQFLTEQDYSTYNAQVSLRLQQTWSPTASQRLPEIKSITHSPHISKVRYFSNTSVKELCSTVYNGLLYISKVDLRLKEINDIPFQDQLYLYEVCLEGFKILYEKAGFFYITEEMVFFDQQGQAYVWMNPNLAKQEPNYDPAQENSFDSTDGQGSQSEMLKTLITLIEQNTDSTATTNTVSFRSYLEDRGLFDRLSFHKALEQFHRYCGQYHLTSNRQMKAIHELYHAGDQSFHRSEVKRVEDAHEYEAVRRSMHQIEPAFSFYGERSRREAQNQMEREREEELQRRGRNGRNSQIGGEKKEALFVGGYGEMSRERNEIMTRSQMPNNSHGIHRNISAAYIESITVPSLPSNHVNPHTQSRHAQPFTFSKQTPAPIPPFDASRSMHKTQSIATFNPNRPVTFRYINVQPLPFQPTRQEQNSNPPTNKTTPRFQRRESIIEQLNSPHLVKNINAGLQQNHNRPPPPPPAHKQSNKLTYYSSSSEAYTLDSEIAQDIEKYLGTHRFK